MITILFAFFIHLSSWALVNLEMKFSDEVVNQGEIAEAQIIYYPTEGQAPTFPSLKGKKIGKVIFINSVSPFVGKEGQGYYIADAKIIFASVPESNIVSDKINDEELKFNIGNIRVQPTEAKEYQFGSFDVPRKINYTLTIIVVFSLLLLAFGALFFVHKVRKKNAHKVKMKKIADEILSATNYEGVVEVWKKKKLYIDSFPILEKNMSELEKTLFMYQFKPTRTDLEIQAVLDSYEKFKQASKGILNGI